MQLNLKNASVVIMDTLELLTVGLGRQKSTGKPLALYSDA